VITLWKYCDGGPKRAVAEGGNRMNEAFFLRTGDPGICCLLVEEVH
jgi:hypothetical protein